MSQVCEMCKECKICKECGMQIDENNKGHLIYCKNETRETKPKSELSAKNF